MLFRIIWIARADCKFCSKYQHNHCVVEKIYRFVPKPHDVNPILSQQMRIIFVYFRNIVKIAT